MARYFRVTSSEGKTHAVKPMSTAILATVPRAAISMEATAGPKNSRIFPVPAFAVKRLKSSRMRSLPETQG